MHGNSGLGDTVGHNRNIERLGSLFSTLALTVVSRRDPRLARLAICALLCILGTQVVFWVFTDPVNHQTQNWTILPENWMQLRGQWEYSHAVGAALDLVALVTLLIAAITSSR